MGAQSTWSAPDARAAEPPRPAPEALPTHDDLAAPRPAGGGAPRGAPLVTHPRSRFDIIDTALDTIKAAPTAVLGATAAFLLPAEIVSVFVRRGQLDASDINDAITTSWFAAVALRMLTLAFVTFVVAHLIAAWQRGDAPRARDATSAALHRSPAILVAWAAVHVAEALAGVALLLPLLFVAPLLLATVPAMAVEGCGPFAAMRRSWRLSARDPGTAIGAYVVIAVVAIGLASSLSGVAYLSDALFSVLGLGGAWVVRVGVGIAVWLVVLPFIAAAASLQYFDLRVRREGLDIELGLRRQFGDS